MTDQHGTVFELTEGLGAGKDYVERLIGGFPTLEAARDFAVPDHPDEWVKQGNGSWFHGGGNFPGQSFKIEQRRVSEGHR